MDKRTTLNEIIKCCEIRFDRGDAATWKHGYFVDLHRDIQLDTNTNISPSTLKRIFGKVAVDDEYVPQQATLDALKKYGRYVETVNPQIAQPTSPPPLKKTGRFNRRKITLCIVIVSAAIIGVLIWRLSKPNNISGKINITRIEGQLPATSFFELQLPETNDSLFVNFGDKSPLVFIKPGEKKAAHIYYFPGVFTVSVLTRQQTIAATNTYIKSDNWIAFACHRQDDIPVHFYAFPVVKNPNDSSFKITNTQLSTLGLDTTGPILSRLSNYTPVSHNADDFIFETSFKNFLPDKGVFCRSTQFQIAGSNSMIRFRLVSSGCSLRILNVVSEQTFKGATDNLSQFVFDLGQWNNVKLVNRNKQVTLFVKGKEIFSGSYQQSLGDLRGLFLEFEGTGIVKTCDLKSSDGKVLYHF
ncbi:hypothetical protein [Ferruginibacter profundus]